jgi:hypothetical protein
MKKSSEMTDHEKKRELLDIMLTGDPREQDRFDELMNPDMLKTFARAMERVQAKHRRNPNGG